MSKYRLVFAGELLHGVDRRRCIDQLAKIVDETPERLAVKLFGGRHVVVKQTDDEKVVKKFVAAFKKAGAVLLIDVNKGETRKKRIMASDAMVTRERDAIRSAEGQPLRRASDPDSEGDGKPVSLDDQPTIQRKPMFDAKEAASIRRRRRRRR